MNLNVIRYTHINSEGMDGGTRIFIECAKRWVKNDIQINVFTCKEGYLLYTRNGLRGINFIIWPSLNFQKFGISPIYLLRTIIGGFKVLGISLNKGSLIYSSSDFWPDVIPAIIMKLKNPKSSWIAAFYLFAPKPWQIDNPYKGKNFLTGLFYWLTQLPIYWIVKRYADYVFVTSESDVKKFITPKRSKDKIVVVQGGVDITSSEKYLKSEMVIPVAQRKYDACFLGRFHYQKGVLELVDIWKMVCQEKPKAKLAMIGNGSLETEVRKKIKKHGLKKNIDLLGFRDGQEKYDIFKQVKIMVHPATYDSGGMASAEGMGWGLPGVSFDLEALKTYYPKGMIKTKVGDKEEFAKKIINLLENKVLYEKTANDAHNLIIEAWDWNKRAKLIYNKLFSSNQ